MHVTALAPSFAPARSGPPDGLGDAPPLPVGDAARSMTQPGTRDVDPEDLAGVSDDKVTDPLWQRRLPSGYRVLSTQGLLQGAPLGVREAHEDALVAGKRFWGPPAARHGVSEI